MRHIHTEAEFECIGVTYYFAVSILVDTVTNYYRFHFTSVNHSSQQLPLAARQFDIVATFHRHILFNRLAPSKDRLQEAVKDCVEEYVRSFSHPAMQLSKTDD